MSPRRSLLLVTVLVRPDSHPPLLFCSSEEYGAVPELCLPQPSSVPGRFPHRRADPCPLARRSPFPWLPLPSFPSLQTSRVHGSCNTRSLVFIFIFLNF